MDDSERDNPLNEEDVKPTEEAQPEPEPEPEPAKPSETPINVQEQLDPKDIETVDQLATEVGVIGPIPTTTSFNVTTAEEQATLEKAFEAWSKDYESRNVPEVERWTAAQFKDRYAQNITNAYNFMRIASDNKAQTEYATYGNFVRDTNFDDGTAAAYYDEGSKTAWLAIANDESLNTQMRLMGAGGDNAIINTPAYGRLRQTLYEFAFAYGDKAKHIKLTGFGASATMILQHLLRDNTLRSNFTFVSLFNMPRANSNRQRANFKVFLNQNPQIALFGAEFDRMNPDHRLFNASWRNHILGAETNKQLNLTRAAYEQMLQSSRLQPKNIGSTLDVWGDFFNETPVSEKDLVNEITGQRVVPESALNEVDTQQMMLAGQQTSFLGYDTVYDLPKRNEYKPGWNPVLVQMGGESGLGEGKEFVVYKWGTGGQWANDALRNLDENPGFVDNLYQPWHKHRLPSSTVMEITEAYNKVGDGLDRMRTSIFKFFRAMPGGTDAFGKDYPSPFMQKDLRLSSNWGIDLERRNLILLNLYNIRDKKVLREVKRGIIQIGTTGSKRGRGGRSTYNDPSQQFVGVGPNGKKQLIMSDIERVFYPAVKAYVEEANLESTPNLLGKETQTDAWNWWTRQARDMTNMTLQPTLSMGIAWLISKGFLAYNMGRGGVGNLPAGEAREVLERIQFLNMREAGNTFLDPQVLNRMADLIPMNPAEAYEMILALQDAVLEQTLNEYAGVNLEPLTNFVSTQLNLFIANNIQPFVNKLLAGGFVTGSILPRYLKVFDDVGNAIILRESSRMRQKQRYRNLGVRAPAYLPAPEDVEERIDDYLEDVVLPRLSRLTQSERKKFFNLPSNSPDIDMQTFEEYFRALPAPAPAPRPARRFGRQPNPDDPVITFGPNMNMFQSVSPEDALRSTEEARARQFRADNPDVELPADFTRMPDSEIGAADKGVIGGEGEPSVDMGPAPPELERDPVFKEIEAKKAKIREKLSKPNLSKKKKTDLRKQLKEQQKRERTLRQEFIILMQEGRSLYDYYRRYGRGFSPTFDKTVDRITGTAGRVYDIGSRVFDVGRSAVNIGTNIYNTGRKVYDKATSVLSKADKVRKKGQRLVEGVIEKVEEEIAELEDKDVEPIIPLKGKDRAIRIVKGVANMVQKELMDAVEEEIIQPVQQELINPLRRDIEEAAQEVAKPVKNMIQSAKNIDQMIREVRAKVNTIPNGFMKLQRLIALKAEMDKADQAVDDIKPTTKKQTKQKKKIKKVVKKLKKTFLQRMKDYFMPQSPAGAFRDSPEFQQVPDIRAASVGGSPIDLLVSAGRRMAGVRPEEVDKLNPDQIRLRNIVAEAQRKNQSEKEAIAQAFQGVSPSDALRSTEEEAARIWNAEQPGEEVQSSRISRPGVRAADRGVIDGTAPQEEIDTMFSQPPGLEAEDGFGVDPQEALRAGRRFYAEQMNQSYRNIDGVQVTGAQDNTLQAADQGVIGGDGPQEEIVLPQPPGLEADADEFQGVDPQEALRAGRKFYAEQMNQSYRNIDGVEVTGAQDDTLQAADKGIIEPSVSDDDINKFFTQVPDLEKGGLTDMELSAGRRMAGVQGDEVQKLSKKQIDLRDKVASLAGVKKKVKAFKKVLKSKKRVEQLKKQNIQPARAKAMLKNMEKQVEIVERVSKKYDQDQEFIYKQLDAMAKEVARDKQMDLQSRRAAYLRSTFDERMRAMPNDKNNVPGLDYELTSGMQRAKKTFTFDRPTSQIADDIMTEAEAAMEPFEARDYSFVEEAASIGIAAGTSTLLKGPFIAATSKVGAILGAMFGPGGAAVGATAGGILGGMFLGVSAKKFGDYVVRKARSKSRKQYLALSQTDKRMIAKLNDEKFSKQNKAVAFAAAVGGTAQYVWNRVNPVPIGERWRGPAHEMQTVYNLLPNDMRDLLNRARANFPQMRGEANYTGPGASAEDMAMGSWQTYLHRMAYMDPEHARPILQQLANSDNTDNAANLTVMQLMVDWMTTHAPNLMQDVLLRAMQSAALYTWVDSVTKQQPLTSRGIIGQGGRKKKRKQLYILGPKAGQSRVKFNRPAGPPARRPTGKKKGKGRSKKEKKEEKGQKKEKKEVRKRSRKKKKDTTEAVVNLKKPKVKIRTTRPKQGPRSRSRKASATDRDSLLKLFKRLDKDKSGQLSVKEVGRLSKRLKLSAKEIMKRMDKSGNNGVDFKEFAAFMRNRLNN